MFSWLFGREITREEAIRIATQFVLAEWQTYTADWPKDEAGWPYDSPTASCGGNYWYVLFPRRTSEVVIRSDRGIEVWVHKKTGQTDHCDNIGNWNSNSLDRGE